jgi:hypothetical protein
MSTIRVIYHGEQPTFPASDNHPQAVRYMVDHPTRGKLFVDARGGEPTLAEIDAVLAPPEPE